MYYLSGERVSGRVREKKVCKRQGEGVRRKEEEEEEGEGEVANTCEGNSCTIEGLTNDTAASWLVARTAATKNCDVKCNQDRITSLLIIEK